MSLQSALNEPVACADKKTAESTGGCIELDIHPECCIDRAKLSWIASAHSCTLGRCSISSSISWCDSLNYKVAIRDIDIVVFLLSSDNVGLFQHTHDANTSCCG